MISANTTHILNSTEVMFGTRYEVQVRCIYQDDYESEPAIAHLITGDLQEFAIFVNKFH